MRLLQTRGGKSSRTSGWTICAMTGCDCLSFIICMISATSAGGSSTSASAAANGLSESSTMATSISPPSFLMSADRPACILFKIAKALFSQIHLSHSSADRTWPGGNVTARHPLFRCLESGTWAGIPTELPRARTGPQEGSIPPLPPPRGQTRPNYERKKHETSSLEQSRIKPTMAQAREKQLSEPKILPCHGHSTWPSDSTSLWCC